MKSLLKNLTLNHTDYFSKKAVNTFKKKLSNKELELYNDVIENRSENYIAKKLYDNSPSAPGYQRLQNRFFDKFIHEYLTIDFGYNIQKEKAKIIRMVAVCRILGMYKLKSVSIPLAEKVVSKCIRYELWYELLDLYRLLAKHYATIEVNSAKAKKYRNLLIQAQDIYSYESQIEWLYSEVRFLLRSKKKDKIEKIIELTNSLSQDCIQISRRTAFYYYSTIYSRNFALNDIDSAIDVCNEALEYFESFKVNHEMAKNYFRKQLIYCSLVKGEFEIAEYQIKEQLKISNPNTYSFYRFKELLFRTLIYNNDTEEASELLPYLRNKSVKLGEKDSKDRVVIYEMYLNLLTGNEINFKKARYNVNRLKDEKYEIWIPFKICEICYLYLHSQDELYDKIGSLEQYAYHHLSHTDFKRTKSFIKIISKILRFKSFDISTLTDDSEVSNNSVEIVRYETLINLLLTRQEVKLLVN